MEEKKPRISVNKLAEYMISDALRRRQIVKDAKYQEPFKTSRYSDARIAIKRYILNGLDDNIIEEGKSLLKGKKIETEFEKDNIENSLLSLECILDTSFPDLSECVIKDFTGDNFLINLSGLDISVNPDLIITNSKGKKGGIKIHIAKGNELIDPSMSYVATLIKYFFMADGIKEKDIENNLCFSFDIFRCKYESAPVSYKRTVSKIEAACEKIVFRWKDI